MNIVCRLFIVFVLCHAAYAASCQQVSADYAGNNTRFIDGPVERHYWSEVVTDIVIAPKVTGNAVLGNTKVITPGDAERGMTINNSYPGICDSAGGIQVADSVTINDTTAVAGANDLFVPIYEPAEVAGPSIPDASFVSLEDPVIGRYADIMNIDPLDIDNYPLYRFIDKWYGAKYRWGGKDRKGIDCSAFAQRLYTQVYEQEIKRTTRQQRRSCERIKNPDDAEEGDLVFFRVHRTRISHVGVYLANGYFVHVSKSQGVVVTKLTNKYWHKRYADCGRIEKKELGTFESDLAQ